MASLGWLKNGNPAASIERLFEAPRCGARRKYDGQPCQKPALKGKKRCQLHGGRSTGPKTDAGKLRVRKSVTKHGRYAGPGNPINDGQPGPLWKGKKDPASVSGTKAGLESSECV